MQESVAIAWCDNGMVDGLFAQGICDVTLKSGVTFGTALRSNGNQIARQRDTLMTYWYDQTDHEWLLWVDSDVVISVEGFLKLWNHKDKDKHPMVTGVYFTTSEPEVSLMDPRPTVFNFAEREDGGLGLLKVHPLPKDKFMKVDAAGMGYILMHRSVVTKLREQFGDDVRFFAEQGKGEAFIGEDIYFFALCAKANIPLWCDTSVVAPHMKRFSFDVNYYNAMYGGKRK
jgi:hypothetical protein